MPKFDDLTQYLDDTLTLNIRGVDYVIPPLSAEDGLWAQQLMNLSLEAAFEQQAAANRDPDKPAPQRPPRTAPVLDDVEEKVFYERMLSKPVLEQMTTDRVSWPQVKRAAETAFLWATADENTAQARWRDDGSGKALSPSRPGSPGTGRSRKKGGRSGSKTSRKHGRARTSPGGGSSSGGH
jgi:hypothetical protein